MVSDIIVEPDASAITAPPVKSAASTFLSSLPCGLKRLNQWLRSIADAPVLHVGALVEAQALLGLPLRTPFDDQDFLWRRHNQGVLYEPDPFATELPFQRDMWPF